MASLSADRAVFARTYAGQRAAIASPSALTPAQQRLLLLVNGYTPLGELARLLPEDDVSRVAVDLVFAGFIALASRFAEPAAAQGRAPASAQPSGPA